MPRNASASSNGSCPIPRSSCNSQPSRIRRSRTATWRRQRCGPRGRCCALAREGGLAEPSGVRAAWDEAGIHGTARAREWDLVATVAAPEIQGDAVDFVALPDGSLLVEEEQGDANLEPLATAVEQKLQPPY